ncbi:hypothetical protein ABLE92_15845 [Gordonia sp. VNQ95]|uniref:hypothetical protein n=1 Tax=Gordonia sp. VNQ95 TaxID=3156619 RepID=UPI0032B3C02F
MDQTQGREVDHSVINRLKGYVAPAESTLAGHEHVFSSVIAGLEEFDAIRDAHGSATEVYGLLLKILPTSLDLLCAKQFFPSFSLLRSSQELSLAYAWFWNQPFEARRWSRENRPIPTTTIREQAAGIFSTQFLRLSNIFTADVRENPDVVNDLHSIQSEASEEFRTSYSYCSDFLHMNSSSAETILESELNHTSPLISEWVNSWQSIVNVISMSFLFDAYPSLSPDNPSWVQVVDVLEDKYSHRLSWQMLRGKEYRVG